MNKKLIIVFTRNPELGKCKTRLAASIGNQNALEVYQKLIEHTSTCIQKVDADAVAFYTEKIQLKDAWPDAHFQKQIQIEGHLGEKMQAAFEWGFAQGYSKICIVGSDLLELEPSDLEAAFEKLEKTDLVFGPAEDGGYYLMAMKKLHSAAFADKAWSTKDVLKESVHDLRGKSISLLEIKNDIDTIEDLVQHPDLHQYIPA
jgi:rSAM/selenodomain-associated transferase 1